MTKQEFVDGLTTALNVTGDIRLINENRQFYNDYIDGEIAKGRTETEVLDELGDPRLIAKSIMDAGGYSDDPFEDKEVRSASGNANNGNSDANAGANQQAQDTPNKVANVLRIIIILLVIFGILYLIIKASVSILVFLAPVLVPALIIWLIVSLFRRR